MPWITPARLRSLSAAVAGAAVFWVLGLPLPLLLGPMIGCLILALTGATLQGTGGVETFMRTFLGVAIGTTITPDLVRDLPSYAPSLALIPVLVGLIGAVGYPLFRRVYGYDKATAFYSAMPGGLQDMLAFGEEAGGNVRTMSLIHATRVLIIVSVAPVILTLMYGLDLTAAPGRPANEADPVQLVLMLVAAIVGWQGAKRIGMFGASILGPMILAAVFSLTGLIDQRPPAEVIWAAQFFLGAAIGAKYTGITAQELRRDVGAGVLFSAALAVISLLMLEIVLQFSSAGDLEIILSFLPGGQAEMLIVALVAGADTAFVVAHHLLRMVVVILLAPVVARFLD